MAQNRKPPAYQEYAASMMSKREFKLMSLAERGLLYTIRLECWENRIIPNDPAKLAKYLGLSESEIGMAFTANLKAFLRNTGGDYICPDLEDYREHLAQIRLKQSKGGKAGASITNSKWRGHAGSQDTRQDTCDSLVKLNQDQYSQTQSLEEDVVVDAFVNDYESAEVLNHNF